jgi:hypothetical protein
MVSLIICVAIVLRLNYIHRTEVYVPIRADARNYCIYAQNILNHSTFSKEVSKNPTPDSFWSPGYPTLLATVFYLFDVKNFYPAALLVQAMLGALTAGMVFMTGLFFLPFWAAVAAGVLTAFCPHLISMSSYLLSETLFAFNIVLLLLTYMVAIKTENNAYFVIAGVIAGITYLVNPVIFFFPFIAASIFFFRNKIYGLTSGNNQKKPITLFLIAFMVPWLLWSVRCQLNVDSTSSSSTNRALINFIIGTHDDFFEIWRADPQDATNPAAIDRKMVNGSWLKFLKIFARRVLDNPGHYARWYAYEKPKILWSWDILIGAGDVYVYEVKTSWFQTSGFASKFHSIMKSLHWWLILLSVLGGLILLKFRRKQSFETIKTAYVCVIYLSVVYIILQSEPRYSIPLRPIMYLCAMFGLYQISISIKKLLTGKTEKLHKGIIDGSQA